MNTNFSQWLAERKLKETNLGSLSASGFQDMTGDEADEAGVKRHQQPLRQMFGQRKRPEVFVDPNTLDQLSARDEDPSAYLDDEDAMQNRFSQDPGEPETLSPVDNFDQHANDFERHNMGMPYQTDAASGNWGGGDVPSPHLPPEVQMNPNDTRGYDAQAAFEQPVLSKKQRRELNLGTMKKAIKSWKDYRAARKAQNHVIGDPMVPSSQAEVDDRINQMYPRRFR